MNIFNMWFSKDENTDVPEELVYTTYSLMNFLRKDDHYVIVVNRYFEKLPITYQVLYTDIMDEVDINYLDKCGSLNHKSDYMRTYLVNKYGGVYFDIDTFHVRDFHNYFDKPEYDFVGLYESDVVKKHEYKFINVGIMSATKPGVLNTIITDLRNLLDSNKYVPSRFVQLYKVISKGFDKYIPNKFIYPQLAYYAINWKVQKWMWNTGKFTDSINKLKSDEGILGIGYLKDLNNWGEVQKNNRLEFSKSLTRELFS